MNNLLYVLTILFLLACGKNENITLEKCWKLGEPRTGDFQIYYPCGDQRIQASRFSQTYEFYSENNCKYLVLSPIDAHYFKDGNYFYDRKTATLRVKSLEGDLIAKYKISSLKADELIVVEL